MHAGAGHAAVGGAQRRRHAGGVGGGQERAARAGGVAAQLKQPRTTDFAARMHTPVERLGVHPTATPCRSLLGRESGAVF
jgi:hypothetical protein